MKRNLKIQAIIIIAAIFLASPVLAGGCGKSNIWFGLKVGTDIHTQDLDGDIVSDMKNNYRVGAFAQFGKKLFLQPEVYYARFVPEEGEAISAIKVPVLLGLEMFDLKLVSLNLKGGAEFSKQLATGSNINFLWQAGVGLNILGFITTDVRYSLSKGENVFGQFGDLINNGGMLNVTVGIKFR